MDEVVITGLGPIASNGVGKSIFWEAISSGKIGIRMIRSFDSSGLPCRIAGEIPPEWISSVNGHYPPGLPNSKSCKYSVLATMLALEDAGLTPADLAGYRTAVYFGVSTTDMEVVQREYQAYSSNGSARSDSLISAFPHTPAVIVAQALKSYKKVITISTACTSGLNSIIFGAEAIARGEADLVIAGGVDTPLSPLVLSGFCSANMVPTGFNDRPKEASRPFDQDRQGGVLSEGAGVVILESRLSALSRNAKIYASLSGSGLSTDMSMMRMRTTIFEAMSLALSEACLNPEDIDYICACAPGDPVIDRVETGAIKDLFGLQAGNVPISSIKSMIGNPGAGAGPLQAITAALAIDNNFIPPTVNLVKPGKGCDLDYVPIQGRVARVNRVLINVRGFGGGMSSLVLSKPI